MLLTQCGEIGLEGKTLPFHYLGVGLSIAVLTLITSYQMPLFIPGYESVEGNDTAGIVEAVGEGVSDFKKGDKVSFA